MPKGKPAGVRYGLRTRRAPPSIHERGANMAVAGPTPQRIVEAIQQIAAYIRETGHDQCVVAATGGASFRLPRGRWEAGMNRNIEGMAAGRELDALVAARVMKWTDIGPAAPEMQEHGEDLWGRPHGGATAQANVPPYSTDIAAAWQVLTELEGIYDFAWSLSNDEPGYTFRAYTDSLGQFVDKAETVPLAICRCALKAMA